MNVCFVTPRFPFPTTKGDKLRAFNAIRELGARHEITLVAASDEPLSAGDIDAVARYCKRVEIVQLSRLRSLLNVAAYGAFTSLPLQTLFYRCDAMRERVRDVLRGSKFDIVHASLIRVLPYLWELAEPPVVVDLMDSIARSTAMRASLVSPLLRPVYRLEAARVAAYERAACDRFAELFVCAEPDRIAIGERPNLSVVRSSVDLAGFAYRRDAREDDLVVMTGNQGYAPNVDAVAWFASTVWPIVRGKRPSARFRIVGVRPAPTTRAHDGKNGITVTGPVDDIATELHRATIAVCPMRSGSGVQTKILEAFATGTPIVSTTLGNEGIGALPGREIAIADEPAAFAERILHLLANPELRATTAAAAHALAERAFTWGAHGRAIETLYERARNRRS